MDMPNQQSCVTDALAAIASEALRVSESRYRRLFETAQDGILLLNAENALIEDVNPYLIGMLGYSHAEFLGKKLWEVGPFADIAQSKEMFAELQIKGYVRYDDLPLKSKSGARIAVEFVSNSYDCEGIKVIQCNIRNISERKADQLKIQRHTQLYSALSQCNKAIVHSTSEEELFLLVCRAAVEYGGMKLAWVGLTDKETLMVRAAISFGDGAAELRDIAISADANSPYGQTPTGTAIREDRPFWCQDYLHDPLTIQRQELGARFGWAASASLPLHRNGVVIGAFVLYAGEENSFDEAARNLLVEMAMDISFALDNFTYESQRKQAANEIERLAYYDPLTSLSNRRLLYERLQHTLAASTRHHHYGAVLFIDLDHFKTINDTKGHNIGDLLLIEVARRLLSCVREGDTVARVGGDDFVVILEDLDDEPLQAAAQTEAASEKIRAVISQPYSLQGYEYHCTASIGISLFRNHENSVDELLKRADTAMYQAKDAGRDTQCFFDANMQAALEDRMALEKDLYSALSEKQFRLYYQMQVDHSGHIIGAEALIRWQHPQRGLVLPVQFIPLAEETGLILLIGQWVLETACAQLKAWDADPLTAELQLAVNVSARQFGQPDFVEQVRLTLHSLALDPDRLKLELTESMVLDNIDDTIVKMYALRRIGVRFSMDDFGTGYSSLAYLTRLPLDQLKIDQSFVRNIGVNYSDAVIVQTIIGMAGNLGMEVIAEGVETEQQRAFLQQHGCDFCQGHLFGRPVPVAEFEASLKRA
jgi:diguanylate cyclase (GGDEF)-like protein/PAS domain S-box-containing protein